MKKRLRILSFLASFLILFSFVVPLVAAGESIGVPDWAQPLDNYTKTYEERLEEINSSGAMQNMLSDPNIPDSTKFYLLRGYALQAFDYRLAVELLADSVDGTLDYPVSVAVDVSGSSGCYRSALDGLLHPVAAFSFSSSGSSVCTSDEFTVYLTVNDGSNGMLAFEPYEEITSNWSIKGMKIRPLGLAFGLSMSVSQSGEYFISLPSYTSDSNVGQMLVCTEVDRRANNFTLSRTAFASLFSGYPVQVGAFGSPVELPEGQMDISEPWNYYDDTLKPYLLEHIYNDLPDTIDIDDFLVFPDRYVPQDPPEPPTYPNGGLTIGDIYDIDINIITVTDSNGQPVTDSEGETVTETQIVTDTRPSDAVYNFQIPTIAPLSTVNASLPSISLPQKYVSILGSFYDVIYRLLDSSGVLSVLPLIVGIGVVCYVIYRVGG